MMDYTADVKLRLVALGYEFEIADDWLLGFCIQKVCCSIKNYCNITVISQELYPVAIERICGEFLFFQKQNGKLLTDELNFKSVKLGDVTIDLGSSRSSIDMLIDTLRNEGDLLCFRRLKW